MVAELERRANDLAGKIEKGGGTTRAREQLARHIRNLQAPTLAALMNAPPIMVGGEQRLADIHYFSNGLPEKLDREGATTSVELRFWAQIASEAAKGFASQTRRASIDLHFLRMFPNSARFDVAPPKVQEEGRPPDRNAQIVASTLAHNYALLTGKEPTLPTVSIVGSDKGHVGTVYGEYLDFVKEIFRILNIKRDALRYASVAAYKLRGKGRKK